MFSITDELQRIDPIDLAESLGDSKVPPSVITQWDGILKALGRLGKQQMRANQHAEMLHEQGKEAIQEAREQGDEYRRELSRMRDDARETRLAALPILDALDDLAVIARQRNDASWLGRVDRLTARTLEAFAQMGLTEIPANDLFDEKGHEAVDTLERGDCDPYLVVEVLYRGFRWSGGVLRRAQVVITR